MKFKKGIVLCALFYSTFSCGMFMHVGSEEVKCIQTFFEQCGNKLKQLRKKPRIAQQNVETEKEIQLISLREALHKK